MQYICIIRLNKPKICTKYTAICVPNMQKYAQICKTSVHNKLKFPERCKKILFTYVQIYHMHKYA